MVYKFESGRDLVDHAVLTQEVLAVLRFLLIQHDMQVVVILLLFMHSGRALQFKGLQYSLPSASSVFFLLKVMTRS